jgi:hypothetical protein
MVDGGIRFLVAGSLRVGAGVLTLATVLALGLPAQSVPAVEVEAMVSGGLVAEVQVASEVIASPSATPSDESTMLVTWYGDGGSRCSDDTVTVFPTCAPFGRVVNADGSPVSEAFRLGGNNAPNYYGAPYSTWNPRDREWLTHWNSYAPGDQSATQGGLFLRRVSASGEPLGSVFATTANMVDEAGTTVENLLTFPSNPSLLWLPDAGEWLLLGFFNRSQLGPSAVGYMRFEADLTPITPTWVKIDNSISRAYGVFGALAADGSIGMIYRQPTGDIVFRRMTVGATVSVSAPSVVALNANINRVGGDIAYDPTDNSFLVSYVGAGGLDLRVARVSVEDAPTLTEHPLFDYAAAASASLTVTGVNRSWLAIDNVARELHVVQHAFAGADSLAVHLKFDADDLSPISFGTLGENVAAVGDPAKLRAAGRPVIAQTGDSIAFAYMSWANTWQQSTHKHFVLAGFLVEGASGGSGVVSAPAPYEGPVLARASSRAASVGERVLVTGSNLAGVTRVEVGGVLAESLEVTEAGLSFVLPQVAAGVQDLVVISPFGRLTVQGFIEVLASAAQVSTEVRSSVVSLPGASTAKVYAVGLVGAGKVTFVVNGREVAWVRAADTSDPKLRIPSSGPMAGVSYLVRTVPLVAGKNVIEIYVEGERVRRVAYSR